MGDYHSRSHTAARAGTLNALKEQQHSLNMRMLLAMQNHDEETQEEIKKQMAGDRPDVSGRRVPPVKQDVSTGRTHTLNYQKKAGQEVLFSCPAFLFLPGIQHIGQKGGCAQKSDEALFLSIPQPWTV